MLRSLERDYMGDDFLWIVLTQPRPALLFSLKVRRHPAKASRQTLHLLAWPSAQSGSAQRLSSFGDDHSRVSHVLISCDRHPLQNTSTLMQNGFEEGKFSAGPLCHPLSPDKRLQNGKCQEIAKNA